MVDERKIRILVVDDEIDIRKTLRRDFELAGYEVLEAEGGLEAYNIIEREPIDAVLSDIRMPQGDGIKLVRRIKERDHEKPAVLFITAFIDLASEEVFDCGVEAIIGKPFAKDSVITPLRRALLPLEERWKDLPSENEALVAATQGTEDLIESQSENVLFGKGGAFFELDGDFPHCGSCLRFTIHTGTESQDSPITGWGIVRWARPIESSRLRAGVGLEFIAIDDQSRATLLEKILVLRPKAFIPIGETPESGRSPGHTRRAWERSELSEDLQKVRVLSLDKSVAIAVEPFDISRRGCGVRLTKYLLPGTQVWLEINEASLKMEVAYCRADLGSAAGFRCGLFLIDANDDVRAHWKA